MTAPVPEQAITMYVVYWNPADYPEKFAVRRWRVYADKPLELFADADPLIVADTIEGARIVVPPELVRFPAQPADDPMIYETWL